jgi:hypothetical protein
MESVIGLVMNNRIANLSFVRKSTIVAGEIESNAEVWNWRLSERVCSFDSNLIFGGGHRLAVNCDESVIAVASWNLGIELFDRSGFMLKRISHLTQIHTIQFSDFYPNFLWINSESGLLFVNITTEQYTLYKGVFSNFRQTNNEYEMMVCESVSRQLIVFNFSNGKAREIFKFNSFAILDLCIRNEFILLSEASQYLKYTGKALFLDVKGKLLNEIIPRDREGHFFRVSLSDDVRTFFAVMWQVVPEANYYLQELDLLSGKIIREVKIGVLRFAEFSPDNKFLILDSGEIYSLDVFSIVNRLPWN